MKYKLREICSITKGATGIMKAIPGKYPLVALSDERRSNTEYQFDAKAVIVPLISSSGHGHASMKRVHYQEGKFALGNILCAVIPNDETELSPKYLHLYLQQFKDRLLVLLMKGAANVSLPIGKLGEVEIEVPSLERQLEIIAMEEKVGKLKDELEEELILQQKDLTQLRQSFLREAMQGKLVPQNSKEGNATDLLKKIKEEKEKINKGKKEKPLPEIKPEEIPFEIPKNWLWCKVGDITTSIVPNRDKPQSFTGNIPWITQSNFSDDSYKLNYNLNGIGLTKEEVSKYNCRVMPTGSIIMSCVGQFDLVCLVEKDLVANQQLHCFIPYGELEPMYLCYAVKFFSKLVEKTAIHTTIKYLNKTKCESILIPLPPLQEQNRIVNKLEELMKLCDELKTSIANNQNYTNQLLQAALKEALQPKVPKPYSLPKEKLTIAAEE